jgi:hypothetical protein
MRAMKNILTEQAAAFLALTANSKRLEILSLLMREELSVNEPVGAFPAFGKVALWRAGRNATRAPDNLLFLQLPFGGTSAVPDGRSVRRPESRSQP